MPSLYDSIGVGYSTGRRQDPRIADVILNAIGEARSVVNVGAGSGSYEPDNTYVVSVEPALTMIRQRLRASARLVRANAERLPFPDGAFDCALAVLTIHLCGKVWPNCGELQGKR